MPTQRHSLLLDYFSTSLVSEKWQCMCCVQVFVTKMVVNGFLFYHWYFEIKQFTGSSPWNTTVATVVLPIVIGLLGIVQFYDADVTFAIAEKNRMKLNSLKTETEVEIEEQVSETNKA
jgi:hypothetical protein